MDEIEAAVMVLDTVVTKYNEAASAGWVDLLVDYSLFKEGLTYNFLLSVCGGVG